MPRPWLGEIAYAMYCRALGLVADWEQLSSAERFAWGQAVHIALQAAGQVPERVAPVARLPAGDRPTKAYVLYEVQGRPVAEVCAALGVSRRTLYRDVAAYKARVA